MKRYTVVLTQSAEKGLYKLPGQTVKRIIDVLKSLEGNPRPPGCKKLKGYKIFGEYELAITVSFMPLKKL